jgi:hypothetical protein
MSVMPDHSSARDPQTKAFRENRQIPHATMIVQSHFEGLVLFIMMLEGTSAAT